MRSLLKVTNVIYTKGKLVVQFLRFFHNQKRDMDIKPTLLAQGTLGDVAITSSKPQSEIIFVAPSSLPPLIYTKIISAGTQPTPF